MFELTGAVFGSDGVTVVTRSTDLTVPSGCVVHAAQTLSGQGMTVGEEHVGIGVVVAVTRLTPAAQNHGVSIETRSTPVEERRRKLLSECNLSSRNCSLSSNVSLFLDSGHLSQCGPAYPGIHRHCILSVLCKQPSAKLRHRRGTVIKVGLKK